MFKGAMLVGLCAVSVVAMLVTNANAGCIPLSGGRLYCADYITGSVDCKVKTTKLDCENQLCKVSCTAENTASRKGFAFCKKGYNVTRRACNIPFSLSSDPSFFVSDYDCGPLHNGHQVCEKTLQLKPIAPPGCDKCCTGYGETCVDFTPQTMDTTATLDVGDSEGEHSSLVLADRSKDDDDGDDDDGDNDDGDDDDGARACNPLFQTCKLNQRCTIDPDQILFHKSRLYSCKVKSGNGR